MALSTEWVALKTGQSGSGGVEYSMFYISKTKKALQEGFTVRITGLEPAWVSPTRT